MMHYLCCFCLVSIMLSGCTLGKIIVHFKPDVDDHQKIFVCDTIAASLGQEQFKFVKANNTELLPSLDKWVNKAQQLGASDNLDFLEKTKTTALIIIKNDSILYENYLNGGAVDKTQIVFSVTKAMTATLAAIAIEEELMHSEQSIAEFIPEFINDARKNIKIKHLMAMVSGLKWNDYKDLAKLGNLYYSADHQKIILEKTKIKTAPEKEFAYKSISTQLLGFCLAKAVNSTIAKYMQVKIWDKIGHEQPVYMTLDSDKSRIARTFGGMALSARDMARFGKLLLNDGIWQGKRIVPAWFTQQLRHRDLSKWIGYSNCFWRNGYEEVNFENNVQFWAAGFSGQYIFVSPRDNMLIIRTGLKEKNRWSEIMGRLAGELNGRGNDLTNTKLDFADQFSGKYKSADGREMQLSEMLQKDKYNRKIWSWERDKQYFKDAGKLRNLYQFDGVSIGYKKLGNQTRLYFKLNADKVVGLYYNSWPSNSFEYFEKMDE